MKGDCVRFDRNNEYTYVHIFSVKALRVYVSVLPTSSTTVEISVCFVKFFDNKLPLDGEIRNIEKAVCLGQTKL